MPAAKVCALADGAVAARSSELTTRHIPFQGSLLQPKRNRVRDKEAISVCSEDWEWNVVF
jgi:hypothetical protein